MALITGADSGIGRAVAVLFAREGADVGAGDGRLAIEVLEEPRHRAGREVPRPAGWGTAAFATP